MSRRKGKGARTLGGRLSRALSAILDRNPPSPHILARRETFSFLVSKGGGIDQDTCDGIGQLCALGLLDGWALDPVAMRNAGREFAELWWGRYSASAAKGGNYERASKSASSYDGETARDRRFNRMDMALEGYNREVVMSLVVVETGDTIIPWAKTLIDEALLKRGKVPKFMEFPTMDDRARLVALCQGLCALVDGALPDRRSLAA